MPNSSLAISSPAPAPSTSTSTSTFASTLASTFASTFALSFPSSFPTRAALAAVIAIAGLMLTIPAHAQSIKPGLWEFRSTMKTESGALEAAMAEMQSRMATLPPEERRLMQEAMTAHGIEMDVDAGSGANRGGTNGGGTHVMRACITPQEAAELQFLTDPDCTQEIVQRRPDSLRIRFSCEGEDPSKGEGTISLQGDSRFTGRFRVESFADGERDTLDMTQEARWLADDCGEPSPGR
jgi:hypothetical protein